MKPAVKISLFTFLTLTLSACSNNVLIDSNSSLNLLKTSNDLRIERALSNGTWKYKRQDDDCEDTIWEQIFYKSRYYKSTGAACSVPNAFSVNAENWHLKEQVLYITSLSPNDDEDILIKYGVDYLDNNKLVLSSGKYTYTFIK